MADRIEYKSAGLLRQVRARERLGEELDALERRRQHWWFCWKCEVYHEHTYFCLDMEGSKQ